MESYWAVKGGSGTSVLVAARALALARAGHRVLAVDLDGDLLKILGIPTPPDGVADWLACGDDAPADALDRLAVPVGLGCAVLPRGDGPLRPERAGVLAEVLVRHPAVVVVDAGTRPSPAAALLVARSARSVLVTRACYLAVTRAASFAPPGEIAVVREPDRSLSRRDISDVLGAPVTVEVPVTATIARAVDSGLLASRLPRGLVRSLRAAA